MQLITIHRPYTVVVTPTSPGRLVLHDRLTGKEYYFNDEPTERTIINIPHVGEYHFETDVTLNGIYKIQTPARLPKLDRPTRSRYKQYSISIEDSPDIAAIDTRSGEMIFSKQFNSLPVQIQEFLIKHEEGHFFYVSEDSCDLYALVSCLRMGNNASMCFYAMANVLHSTPANIDRLSKLLDNIQVTQKQPL